MKRVLGTLTILAMLWWAVVVPGPGAVVAWSGPCDGIDNIRSAFAGMIEGPTRMTGARGKIEFANPVLCTRPAAGEPVFSSVWVAVVGSDSNDRYGYNTYQVGIDKCSNGAASSCPSGQDNVPYYFYAYGRMSGPNCGAEVPPIPQKAPLGNAYDASYWYAVRKSGAYYIASIAGVEQNRKGAFYLETCWTSEPQADDGVDGAQYMNEVQDPNSQSGGSVSDSQFISSVTWYDAAGASHSLWRPYNQLCDVHDLSTQRCKVASNLHDSWYSWDSRQP